ncbi:nitrogen fixation protein NifH [Candidatus Bipolaricaulota bacterium]
MAESLLCRNNEILNWLLEEDNPTIRYLTLTELCQQHPDSADVVCAKSAIMKHGIVPRLLEAQTDEGYWGEADRFYVDKYRGTVWQLLMLAEHWADPADKRVQRACEFVMANSQDLESGGFSAHRSAKLGGGRHREVIPCLTGNMVWSLIRLGYGDDPRVRRGIDWITTYQRFDDGAKDAPSGWPYDKAEPCWGRHTCHMGVVKALKALAEIPEVKRSTATSGTVDHGVEYLLDHRIYKRSHDLDKISKPGWTRFGFPLMYQTDVLEILGILTRLDCQDERMNDAINLLISKRDDSGRWILANSFNGKLLIDIETKGQPSKWVTLNALCVLNR